MTKPKNYKKTQIACYLGATVSPALVGSLAELSGGNLKNGLLVAAVFPVVLVIGLILLGRNVKKKA